MSDKILSLFQRACFYNRPYSLDELLDTVGNLASARSISQDHYASSSNRLILSGSHDFVFPGFLNKTIGGHTKGCCLYTAFEVASNSSCALPGIQRMIRFLLDNKSDDVLRRVSVEKIHFEFSYRGVPIFVGVKPGGFRDIEDDYVEPSVMTLAPFGSLRDSLGFMIADDFGFYIGDSEGVGFMGRTLLNDFLSLFADLQAEGGHKLSTHEIWCYMADKFGFDVIQRLAEILQLDDCEFLQGRIQFVIPPLACESLLSSFLDVIETERNVIAEPEKHIQLSCFMNYRGLASQGFICDNTHLLDESYDSGNLKGFDLEKYKYAHSAFLKGYVEWIAATASLKTVSGVIPAYCIAYDRNTRIGLVVLPTGNRFILCQVPMELKSNYKPSPAINWVFDPNGDWVQGTLPVTGDFALPVLRDKYTYNVGEAVMPALAPFAFQNPLVWVRKLKENMRKKGRKTMKGAKPEAGSLDEQLANLAAAGLEFSPGITAMDFLLLDSEEQYRAKSYVSVFWKLHERNSDGVIFSPHALYHSRDYPNEEEMMEDFQRLCGEECRIQNVEYEYYDEDDPMGATLKHVRFTANGEPVEWFLDPFATEMGGLQILVEYFQSFFKERFNDRLLYETNAEYVLLCLSADVAERIGKLSPLFEHPERE